MTSKLATVARLGRAVGVWAAVALLFGLTIWSIWLNRSATAAVAGAFMFALLIFKQLPLVESFKIFTLEAKFRQRLSESSDLLNSIRATAQVSSRLMYYQLAVGDRMSTMSWDLKRNMLSEFDGLLQSLEVPAETISGLKKPFLHIISLDLFRVFEHAVSSRLRWYSQQANQELSTYQAGRAVDPEDPEFKRRLAESRRLVMPFSTSTDIMDDGRLDDMQEITSKLIDAAPLPSEDKELLNQVRSEVNDLDAGCKTAQTITVEAQAYLEKYGRRVDTRAAELFSPGEFG